jgi:hypothetical protein
MPFRIALTKVDVQSAMTDQGYTTARAAYLDAAISSRAAPGAAMALASPYDARLDVAVSSRAAPGAAMTLTAAERDSVGTAIWSRPTTEGGAGTFGERIRTNLDATISSRPSGADWTATRASYLDAAISSRAAPGAAMTLTAGERDAIWNTAIPATPAAGSYGERVKNNLDATISSRADGAAYTAARAANLDNLDALISSRAAPGAAMDLVAGAKTAIWNEAIPATPTAGSYGERIKNNLDATISSRPSGADWTATRASYLDAAISSRAAPGAAMSLASPYDARLDVAVSSRADGAAYTAARAANLDNIGATRMARLDLVGAGVSNSGSVAAASNTAGLTVSLDTAERGIVEVRYSCGGAADFYAEGSEDNVTWYEGDSFSEGAAVTDKVVGYLNTFRYFRFRSPTTGIDLTFNIKALL